MSQVWEREWKQKQANREDDKIIKKSGSKMKNGQMH